MCKPACAQLMALQRRSHCLALAAPIPKCLHRLALSIFQLAKEEAAKAEKEGGKKAAAGGEAAPAAEGGAAADGGDKKGEDGKQ